MMRSFIQTTDVVIYCQTNSNESFKKAERLFQKRQNKQALKAIETVLKKNEKHAESVALKGAILGRLAETEEEKQEAIALCKQGVSYDVTSKNAWAHLARLYQNNQKYEDAIKSFKMALRTCKPNQQQEKNEFRRNLVTLLAQTRGWSELAEVRRQLQLDNQDQLVHWLGYSIALLMAKKYDLALSTFRDFSKNAPKTFADKEIMEMHLFEARILEESGNLQGAFDLLTKLEKVTNIASREEICGRIELILGKFEDAQKRFIELIKDRNPENYDYHRAIQKTDVVGSMYRDIVDKVSALYNDLSVQLPKSMACQRIPLDFCKDSEFQSKADAFVRKYLRKQVPCLFSILKALYVTRPSVAPKALNEIAQARLQELEKDSSDDAKDEKAYTLYFLAQHEDRLDPGCAKALEVIQKAIDLQPSIADFQRFKGRVLKHAGDYLEAFETLDAARQLEPSDRYMNNKAAKYALRANKPDVALALTHLFTRGEDLNSLPDPAVLHDIQCMWFENESGAAFARMGDVISALKNYHSVETHFDQIRDDEFDFHEYCLRRFVLNSYVNFLRMEDKVRTAPAFVRMVKGAVECWIRVFESGEGLAALKAHEKAEAAAKKAAEKQNDESQFAGMTPSERKRAMKKLKQEKLDKEKAELAKKLEEAKKLTGGAAAASSTAKPSNEDEEDDAGAAEEPAPSEEKQSSDISGLSGNKPHRRRNDAPPDPDPKGFKRFATLSRDPLKPAAQLIDIALAYSPSNAELLLLGFDVNVRKKEIAKAWKMLSQAIELKSASDPAVVERLVPFARFAAVSAVPATSKWAKGGDTKFILDDETRSSLDNVLAKLQKPIVELAMSNLASADPAIALSSAIALLEAEAEIAAALQALKKVVSPLKLCVRAQQVLRARDAKVADEHKALAKQRWPRATAFAS